MLDTQVAGVTRLETRGTHDVRTALSGKYPGIQVWSKTYGNAEKR